jgi:hypothetical protein
MKGVIHNAHMSYVLMAGLFLLFSLLFPLLQEFWVIPLNTQGIDAALGTESLLILQKASRPAPSSASHCCSVSLFAL